MRNLVYSIVMQPMMRLIRDLRAVTVQKDRVFALSDLRALLPGHREGAFKSVVTRLEKRGDLSQAPRIQQARDRAAAQSEMGRRPARLRHQCSPAGRWTRRHASDAGRLGLEESG